MSNKSTSVPVQTTSVPESDLSGPTLTRLLSAVSAVGADLDLPTVLRHVVESAVTLVQADLGALGVLDEAGLEFSDFITVGGPEASGIESSPAGLDLLGVLLRATGPMRLGDLTAHAEAWRFPGGQPMTSFLGVPVRVGGTVFGNLYLTDKQGGLDFTEDDGRVLAALAVAAGVAIQNARLYEQARRGSAWREAGRSISTALLSGSAHEDVIALLVETARGVLLADSMLIALEEDAGLRVAAASGARAPAEDPAVLDDIRPVLEKGEPAAATSGELTGFIVPLGPAGRTCRGVMVALWNTPPNPLLVDDLKGFAAQAANALELAERRREAERGAVLADRDRIGRDLHDLVIQRLFATGMRLQGALRLIEADPIEARARVDLAVNDLDATIRELRSTIYGLQAAGHGQLALRARLLDLVDAGTQQLGFVPAMRLDGLLDTAVPPSVAEHVLATVREALSNAARHATASTVEVTVALAEGSLHVVVEDDGVGIVRGGARSGLRNLDRRAADLGGDLTLGAGRLGGTRLAWRVPVS